MATKGVQNYTMMQTKVVDYTKQLNTDLIAVNMKNEVQAKTAEKLYQELLEAGYEVLFDDRKERAGVKFKDADWVGIPVRITVGAKAGDGLVEMKLRRSGDAQDVAVENVIRDLPEWIKRADNPS